MVFLWIFIRIFPIAILSQPLNRQNLPTPPPAPKQMSDLLHSDSCWNNSIALSAGYTNVHIFQSIGEMARRCGAEVAGWTLDRKIRVRFPAYPHRVWALWWQGGKRCLRTYRCPCRGRLGTLKTPSCPWRGCPAAGQNLETGHLSRHYIAEISLNVTLNHNQLNSTLAKW